MEAREAGCECEPDSRFPGFRTASRGSAPGQLGANPGPRLGRAGQLETVRQPAAPWDEARATRNLTYNCPGFTDGSTSHYATQRRPSPRWGRNLLPALSCLLAGPLSGLGRKTSHLHVGLLSLRRSWSLASNACPPLARWLTSSRFSGGEPTHPWDLPCLFLRPHPLPQFCRKSGACQLQTTVGSEGTGLRLSRVHPHKDAQTHRPPCHCPRRVPQRRE